MSSPWTIRCTVPANGPISADELAGIASLVLFDGGALAIGESADPDGSVALTAGFDSEADANGALCMLVNQLPAATATVVHDGDHEQWVLSQRDGLEPTTIGSWTIRTPWHEPANDQRHDVIIDPGAAFGHGAHPSTRLAIELLLRQLHLDSAVTVADLGTGTGVIAIIAALSGHKVRATEVDEASVGVARMNVKDNGVADLVELIHGNATQSRVARDDLVVANVTIDVHRLIAPTYRVADRIIVAGLLCGQVGEMRSLLPDHHAHTVKVLNEWAALSFCRSERVRPI